MFFRRVPWTSSASSGPDRNWSRGSCSSRRLGVGVRRQDQGARTARVDRPFISQWAFRTGKSLRSPESTWLDWASIFILLVNHGATCPVTTVSNQGSW